MNILKSGFGWIAVSLVLAPAFAHAGAVKASNHRKPASVSLSALLKCGEAAGFISPGEKEKCFYSMGDENSEDGLELREKHGGACKGDPDVSPLRGTFRMGPNHVLEYQNRADESWNACP